MFLAFSSICSSCFRNINRPYELLYYLKLLFPSLVSISQRYSPCSKYLQIKSKPSIAVLITNCDLCVLQLQAGGATTLNGCPTVLKGGPTIRERLDLLSKKSRGPTTLQHRNCSLATYVRLMDLCTTVCGCIKGTAMSLYSGDHRRGS